MGHPRAHEIGGDGARPVRDHRQRDHPGLVDTPLTRYEKRLDESIGPTGRKVQNATPQEAWDVRAAIAPMRAAWLQPDDVSLVAVFPASDAANLVTGAEYEVTAGDSAKDV